MTAQIPKNPFNRIALSLSGGGYRAASFHLGSMSYLNSVSFQGKPLLERVTFLSTVSGGTITGIVYAQQKQEDPSRPFEDIYHFLMRVLQTTDMVTLGLYKLRPDVSMDSAWKRKTLINAFAELYDTHFTKGVTFSAFSTMKSHLKAVVFNSTEFTHANNFRFRSSGSGYFGNNSFRVPTDLAEEIKLADAMAASSCFPGGFEPIMFPDDFLSADNEKVKTWKEKHLEPVGLMDGGIYDNQGIQSILLYEKTAQDESQHFDLILISDVASPYMEAYKATGDKEKTGWRNLTVGSLKKKVMTFTRNITLITCGVSAVFLLIPFFWDYVTSFRTGLFVGLSFFPLAVLGAYFIALSKGKDLLTGGWDFIVNKIPQFYRDRLAKLPLDDISIRRAEPLLLDRLNSLLSLLLSVFLKVVRRLNYSILYENDNYEFRRISNLIKELTEVDFNSKMIGQAPNYTTPSLIRGTYESVVDKNIKEIAEEASSFGTTLWFEDKDKLDLKLDKLVATGQFTMCFNLLDYLEQLMYCKDNGFENLPPTTQAELKTMYQSCYQDWLEFKKDPMTMVNKLKQV